VLCCAQLVLAVDVTIVNVANASIERSLGFTNANIVWTVSAYALTFGGFLMLGGRLADMVPRRPLFIGGVAAFAVASIGAGSARTTKELIACRLVQGACAAVISPTTLAYLASTFSEGRDRQRAYGMWATAGSVGGLIGLLLGGLITSALGWRWIFFINGPLAVVAITGSLVLLPRDRSPGRPSRLDLPGALSMTAAVALVIYGLGDAQSAGWASATTIVTLCVPIALLGLFVTFERRSEQPLLPLNLLKRRATVGNVASVLQQSAGGATIFLTPPYLQEVMHYSARLAGIATIPLPLCFAVGSRISSRAVGRIGARPLVIGGFALMAVGLLWLARTPDGASYLTTFLPGLVIRGIGQGMVAVPTIVTVTSGVPETEHGIAAGLYNTSQQLGGALGITAIATVAGAAVTGTATNLVAMEAHGIRVGFFVAFLLALVGGIVGLALPPGRRPGARSRSDPAAPAPPALAGVEPGPVMSVVEAVLSAEAGTSAGPVAPAGP
jgi:EmrB/QacA subfamily drug resistance transporter